jgi:hypothetical protein
MQSKPKLHNDQNGLVAFVIVMIVMILLTLIVLAFGKLVRREQKETLDRQLNTQAFYAAESGVNDAADALRQFPLLANQEYDQCDEFVTAATAAGATINNVIDGAIVYSCLLVDPSPLELTYDSVPLNESVALPLQSGGSSGSVPITSLEIYFNDSSLKNNVNLSGCPGLGTYPVSYPATCQIGILRLELVPFTGPKSRDQLITDRAIAFVQPSSAGGSASFTYASASGDSQGLRHQAVCAAATLPRRCRVTITGIPGMTLGYLRMRSIYRTTGVTIRAFSGGTQVELSGAQAEIDATGRANDILKRIKVTRPIGSGSDLFPEFALQTTRTQCKRMTVAPPNVMNVQNTGVPAGQQAYCDPAQP